MRLHTVCSKTHPENFYHYKNIEDALHFGGINFPANNDTDNFEARNQNVSDNMFEVDDENEQTVISRKLKKDAECHIDVLRIDEDDNSQ